MASRVWQAVLVLVVCGWGVARCTPAEPRQTVAPASRQTVKPAPAPPQAPARPVVKSAPRPLAVPGCRKLLAAYRQTVSGIPYPARLPYLPLLGIGEKLVRRWVRPQDDPVCQAQLRHIMTPLLGRRTGPGLGQPPTLPKADKK